MDFLFGVLLVVEALIGGFGEEVFGGRTGNVLSRTTVVLGALLILNTLGLALLNRGANDSVTGTEMPAPAEQPAQ